MPVTVRVVFPDGEMTRSVLPAQTRLMADPCEIDAIIVADSIGNEIARADPVPCDTVTLVLHAGGGYDLVDGESVLDPEFPRPMPTT